MQTLYFPGTNPAASSLRRFLLFFDAVHCYQAVEGPGPAELAGFMQKGLCRIYPPAPLGSDQDRFRCLLKDLSGYGDEYYSGMLSMMSRRSQPQVDRESVSQLIAAMARSSEEPEDNRREDQALWQARLYLSLAERFEREQREIEKGLLELTGQQAGLFEAIKGDDDAQEIEEFSFNVLQNIKALAPPPVAAGQLLKAWGQLYLRDQENPPRILATDQQAAADFVLEAFAEYSHTKPICLGAVALPDIMADRQQDGEVAEFEEFIKLRTEVREKASGCLAKWHELLSEILDRQMGSGEDLAQQNIEAFSLLATEWVEQLAGSNAQATNPLMMKIFLLPALPMDSFFQKIAASDTSGPLPGRRAEIGMLAVLE